MASAAIPVERPKGLKLLRLALSNRKSACMLGFGFSSGLPYALLIGTLNAWLGEVGVKMAMIGVLSWIGLSYSFKFLWSPLIDRMPLPGLEALGRRKSWILLCQITLVASFVGIALTDPGQAIGRFALFAFLGALASATQDVAIDAWRIDVADEQVPVELLSPIYQFGYRIASIVGGALALVMAARMSWSAVFALMAVLVVLMMVVTARAPDTPRPEKSAMHADLVEPGALAPRARALALVIVGAGWLWAIGRLLGFMITVLNPEAGAKPPSVADFTKSNAPLIVTLTVVVPLVVAATTNWLKARKRMILTAADPRQSALRTAGNHLYSALVVPLAELAGRLGWGVLILIGLILTYTLCYNVWVSFAFPFYLEELKYSKDEVAFASKVFGIVMTMLGISLGGFLFARIGRMPTILIGALLPILGNFAYADLAQGGHVIDAITVPLFGWLGAEPRIMRLLTAISIENISTGLAGAAFVAYLSGIVSKQYTAVQYALLSSLTFLIGGLGRGIAGEKIDQYGYAPVFIATAGFGLVSVLFVVLEWVRVAREQARLNRESRG
mgnify:CR=1 FL=1